MNTTLTAIPGILVGHAHDLAARTGCTVVLLPAGTRCAADVRGGAPGTRETDLLKPTATVQHADAILLAGGSAFGLAAADGVMRWLREQGRGFATAHGPVPIVPAAVLYDLGVGAADRWPDAAMGYAACASATETPVQQGQVGAGCGATAGKLLGMAGATATGLGSAAARLPNGLTIAALAVTNPFGDIYRVDSTELLAGARGPDGAFVNTAQALRDLSVIEAFGNTTLCVVATDATLDKASCRKLAEMAQDALPRTIRPIHTPFDGDIVFAAATCARPPVSLAVLGTLAADVLAEAIMRSTGSGLKAEG
ncbi:MAG: P1 family peptidase [Roseiflexaceae bacterium]|nr:P1 family peptidase [Roseiflexaceae bacterium]